MIKKPTVRPYKMLPDTYYIWVGGSCDYAHEERASAGAYILQQNNRTLDTYITSAFHTTEFRMILSVMIHALETLPEQSKIVFLTNVSYIQNFDKAPISRANDIDPSIRANDIDPTARANEDLIRTCIRLKARHTEVQVRIIPYHKYPELPQTHEMAHQAMMELREKR